MQFDRKITISAGSSRRAMVWQAQTLLISELWAKLQTPARGTEPLAEYLNMKKAQQDDLKDVGGFMAGTLSGPRRKANNVTGRDVITLDLDNIPPGGTEDVLRRVEGLSCGYCIYSTRKHSPAAPRLRVLLPLDRTASADEYEPIARKMAEYIGLELCDPTTFEVSRLMYWPSCCSDCCPSRACWASMRTGVTVPSGPRCPAPKTCPLSWQSSRVTRRPKTVLWALSAAPMTSTVPWMSSSPACMSRWRVCRAATPTWAAPQPAAQSSKTAARFTTPATPMTRAASRW